MTEAQAIQKVCQTFRDARETAEADSLTSYLLFGQQPPPFSDILMDIDSLFKVNHISNALDIVNELNFKSSSATEVVAKIENFSKLVSGANVTIRVIFMALAMKDNIPMGGRLHWPVWTDSQNRHVLLSSNPHFAKLFQSLPVRHL